MAAGAAHAVGYEPDNGRRGYLLVRRGDGAARYFKPGDDAKQFWSDLKGVEEANTPWIAQTQIDHLLSRYDDKLDLEG